MRTRRDGATGSVVGGAREGVVVVGTERVVPQVVFEGLVNGVQAAAMVNAVLAKLEYSGKPVRAQMVYQYMGKGYIETVEPNRTDCEKLNAWIVKFVTRNVFGEGKGARGPKVAFEIV